MSDTKDARAARSAAALRENLKRRKAHTREASARAAEAERSAVVPEGTATLPGPNLTDEEAAQRAGD